MSASPNRPPTQNAAARRWMIVGYGGDQLDAGGGRAVAGRAEGRHGEGRDQNCMMSRERYRGVWKVPCGVSSAPKSGPRAPMSREVR